jgi:hypothetical protein
MLNPTFLLRVAWGPGATRFSNAHMALLTEGGTARPPVL